MFEILTLVALIGVLAAVKKVLAEHQRKKEAEKNWEKFQKKNPPKPKGK